MASTTLAAAQADTDLVASVADAHSLEGDFLIQIDDELELVERRGTTTGWQVKRGMFGTTPADHDEDADVTIVLPQVQSGALADPPASDGVANVADAVAELDLTASGSYDDTELQSVADKVDELIAALVAAGLMAAS